MKFDSTKKNYKNLAYNLVEYEKENVYAYSEYDETKRIFSNEQNPELLDSLNKLPDSQENTLMAIYYWAKGELGDIEALKTAVTLRNASRKKVDGLKKANES